MRYKVGTSVGEVWLYGRVGLRERAGPAILMLHGAFGTADGLVGWFDRLEPHADLLLASLPRHGGAPALTRPGVEGYISAFAEAVGLALPDRPLLVVGQSLGGLVALGLAGHGHPAVAFDPFLTTAKLWPVGATLRRLQGRGETYDETFVDEVFGFRAGQVVDRDHRPLIARLGAATLVAAGTVPLRPARDLEHAPSLLDEDDRALLISNPRVRFVTFEGLGHALMEDAPDRCRDLILESLDAAVS